MGRTIEVDDDKVACYTADGSIHLISNKTFNAMLFMDGIKDKDEVYFIHLGISPENKQWADRSYGFLDSAKNDPKFINYIEDGDGVYWVNQVTDQICVQFLQDTFNSNPDKTFLILGTFEYSNTNHMPPISASNHWSFVL